MGTDRRTFLLMPLALAACGFTPAYQKGGPAEALLGQVRAADPDTKEAFAFVQRIEERLGRPERHLYDLDYAITTKTDGVGVTADNRTTRYNISGVVTFRISDTLSGAVLASGRAQSFTAFNATGSTVAMLAAEEDAQSRLMSILADQVVARLIAEMAALQRRNSARASGPSAG
ncbi:LPS assembly lipoprotein LptE [Rhodobacter sp. 24-YEA-8]|uniref:LPS assembly lipoprotein LptE n=1 Tax=Rhodobacter sp. 24-YEA-8 TaxID=1884310 RepID=UPI00089B6D01|nr:LPS assembly lipoprotein LptE [Rhodobacter sp. 24-YEA-8]SEC53418.1 LPS-assembly lipoprotein [Rhodobacter sp. 24-YEA-8]